MGACGSLYFDHRVRSGRPRGYLSLPLHASGPESCVQITFPPRLLTGIDSMVCTPPWRASIDSSLFAAVHPRLGDAQVDGQIQMRKETAEVAVRTAERDLNQGVTVLRAARSKAQSRVRDAHSDAESLAVAKANFASKVEDNQAAEMELQTVRSEAAKEKAKLVTEEAREEHAVLLAKAREQQAAQTLTAANLQLEKGSKLSEASIAHAEQSLQDKTLQVH